ncbi:MAG: hypothetical protein AAFX06_02875 [Planctomycetota bacterium]
MVKTAVLLLTMIPVLDSTRSDVERVIVAQRVEESPQQDEAKKKAAAKQAADAKGNKNTRKRDTELEKIVLPMVENHLPDLKVLLDRLRKSQPKQYDNAIRDLSRYAKRLETARKRSEESFEVELEVVKAQSSANLLIARLRVRDNKKDREALKKATKQIHEAELAKLKFDHAQILERLKRMQQQVDASAKQLQDHESKDAESIDKTYAGYLRKAGRKPNKTSKETPAPNPTPKKDRS